MEEGGYSAGDAEGGGLRQVREVAFSGRLFQYIMSGGVGLSSIALIFYMCSNTADSNTAKQYIFGNLIDESTYFFAIMGGLFVAVNFS